MKSYQCIDFLKEKGINFKYTAFDQGALAEMLDPDWLGACNALANEWMLRKTSVDNMQTPVIKEIKDPHLPHFAPFGDNSKAADEKTEICLKKNYETTERSQDQADGYLWSAGSNVDTFDESINNFLNYIESKEFHYGTVSSHVIILDSNKGGLPDQFGHTVSFVKRGNEISWFDPNYGEITFSHFSDFKTWFNEEAKQGTLSFIFNSGLSKRKYESLAEVFPQPQFTQDQKENQNPFSKQIIKKRAEAQDARSAVKEFILTGYDIKSFSSEKYTKPEHLPMIDEAQEKKSESQINLIKSSMLGRKGLFGIESASSDPRNKLLWEIIRKAEKREIKYTEALEKINKMHKFKIDDDFKQPNIKVDSKKRL